MNYLLVTNDFPPKVGGIQNYLWELWRRLPAERTSVYCTPYRGATEFDAQQGFAIERSPEPVLVPYPWLGSRIRRLATKTNSSFVVLDPALPLGHIGPSLGIDYAVVLHGAEVAIPGRIPGTSHLLRRTLQSASLVISAGDYALAEAERCVGHGLPSVVIPPGVDGQRFRPRAEHERNTLRASYRVNEGDLLLSAVSRLVPRKGFDTLIRAIAKVNDELSQHRPGSTSIGVVETNSGDDPASGIDGTHSPKPIKRLVAIVGGSGREQRRLKQLAERLGAPVEFPGRLEDDAVADLYGASDMMAMLCRERWFGLEQEGFGIAFLEAAASGLPQIAGRSGGSHEAVDHGRTGIVIDDPEDHLAVASEILRLIADSELRLEMGRQARLRALADFSYDHLADELHASISNALSSSDI